MRTAEEVDTVAEAEKIIGADRADVLRWTPLLTPAGIEAMAMALAPGETRHFLTRRSPRCLRYVPAECSPAEIPPVPPFEVGQYVQTRSGMARIIAIRKPP